jgi:uncharacterized protein YoxC
MATPENHTLRLLQEIRGSLRSVDQKVDGLSDKVDRIRDDLKNRVDDLTRVFAGESVLGRYAADDVDKRLEALEKRISVLEKRR